MIKVLRIINRFNLGGPTYNAAYLTKYLPSEYETLLVGGVAEKHEADSLHIVKSLNIEPIILPEMSRSIHPLNDWKAYFKLRKIIKQFRPDIVHTHASKAGLLGRLAAIHENVPVIVHTFHGHIFHSYFHPLVTKTFLNIERYLAKRTSTIVAISELQKRELSQVFKVADENKFEVIPLGLDLRKFAEEKKEKRSKFRSQHNLPENYIVIGIVGRLVPIKNHYLLIDAIQQIKSKINRSFELMIVGDGSERENLIQYVQEKNLSYRTNPLGSPADVYFTSWIKEMDGAYAAMDIVALSSKNEGTPVSLLEAQAAGKFVVSTNVGGVKDIVHPSAGIIVEDFNVESFANALLKAIESFEKVNYQIENIVSPKIIEQYSYTRLIENMDNLYKKLLNQFKR
jgi:glycosyltransferase involved in cell wall biosynthesis